MATGDPSGPQCMCGRTFVGGGGCPLHGTPQRTMEHFEPGGWPDVNHFTTPDATQESTADKIARIVCGAPETMIDEGDYHNGWNGIRLGILIVIFSSDPDYGSHLVVDGVPDAIPGTTVVSASVAQLARARYAELRGKQEEKNDVQ